MATPMNQERKDEDKIKAAVKTMVEWAKEENCPLRALIAIMSYGGIWHNALVYDKVLRAAVDPKGGGLSMEELQEAAVKRLCLENRAKGQDFQGVETIFNKQTTIDNFDYHRLAMKRQGSAHSTMHELRVRDLWLGSRHEAM